jgi:hypothetical protein
MLDYLTPSSSGIFTTVIDSSQSESYPEVPALFCRALYDYEAKDASALSFRQNDIIEVLTQLSSGWWDGLLNDERGWFPSNYVTAITNEEAELAFSGSELSNITFNERVLDPSEFWMPQVTSEGQVSLLLGFRILSCTFSFRYTT